MRWGDSGSVFFSVYHTRAWFRALSEEDLRLGSRLDDPASR